MFDPFLTGVGSTAVLLALIALRVPIAVALLGVSFVGIWLMLGEGPALSVLTSVPYTFAASWTLSSIPMFLLMGYIAYHTGLTQGLFRAARAWLGWLPGGLAIASLAGAGGFSAVTGSSVACSAAIGRIAVPEMRRSGYDMGIATGSVAAGGTIGALIPPSIILILFGIQAQVSITTLFLYGIIVGLASLALYISVVLGMAIARPHLLPRGEPVSREEKLASLLDVWPTLLLVTIVFGGLFSGLFTATESGAVGALLATLIAMVRKRLNRVSLFNSLSDTLVSSGSLFMVAVGANAYTRLIALSGISSMAGSWINSLGASIFLILLAIALVYLLLGMFLEPIGAMLLTLPVILPIVGGAGIDVLWFGLLLAKLLEIGMITPPVGLNVFVIHSIAKDFVKLETIFMGVIPFLIMDLLFVFAMIVIFSI